MTDDMPRFMGHDLFKVSIEEKSRGSFMVRMGEDEIAFSNGADLLHWLHGELQGPRVIRQALAEPPPPERRSGLIQALRGAR